MPKRKPNKGYTPELKKQIVEAVIKDGFPMEWDALHLCCGFVGK